MKNSSGAHFCIATKSIKDADIDAFAFFKCIFSYLLNFFIFVSKILNPACSK